MKITINALTDLHLPAPSSEIGTAARKWMLGKMPPAGDAALMHLGPPAPANLDEWMHPRVGWGVVIPAKEGFSHEDRVAGRDIAGDEVLQALLKYRKGLQGSVPIFHYGSDPIPGRSRRFLRNYAAGMDVELTAGIGLEGGQLPFYLLVYASPREIPWDMQAILQVQHAVGRIDPAMVGKDHYFKRVIEGWSGSTAKADSSVVWTVAHDEMTRLMRTAFALPLYEQYRKDPVTGSSAILLDGGGADPKEGTVEKLIAVLENRNPAMIVTSSHGKTGPLDDLALMTATLGLPVDQFFQMLNPDRLMASWRPDGAVWIAQACCSAGSEMPSQYEMLFEAASDVGRVLRGVAAGGALIAPLPERLLGHASPARGFFGHVEPTFNLTLQSPMTGQLLTDNLVDAFYHRLYQPSPLGRVLNHYHSGAAVLQAEWLRLIQLFDAGQNVDDELLYTRTTAIDINSFVFLGDPTAILPST